MSDVQKDMAVSVPGQPKPKRAPTLYFIIAIKWIKGVVLLLLALSIFSLANKDLPDLFNRFLEWVHLDPERSFFVGIANWLDTITPTKMGVVALGTFLYGLLLLVGGTGLAFRAKWAIWLAIGESAFFIPIEVFELIRRHRTDIEEHHLFPHPKIGLLIVLAFNVLIVWYLLKNRRRLFRHHH
jgi:uncharacterized membrane protein (DUF2068 family)